MITIFSIEAVFNKEDKLIGTQCNLTKEERVLDIIANTIVNTMKERPNFEKAMLDNLAKIYKNERKDY